MTETPWASVFYALACASTGFFDVGFGDAWIQSRLTSARVSMELPTRRIFSGMIPRFVYCAGPLFNQSERDEMSSIAETLVAHGHSVYLPHRDGMEFSVVREVLIHRGWEPDLAGQFLHEAIFALDVFQLGAVCDAMVWNMNGRVPDEGAVSEAAMAWTLGIPLIAYRNDARSMIAGRMNPLLAGLVDFITVQSISDLPPALLLECQRSRPVTHDPDRLPTRFRTAIQRGKELWKAMQSERAVGDCQLTADCVTRLFAPVQRPSPRNSDSHRGR